MALGRTSRTDQAKQHLNSLHELSKDQDNSAGRLVEGLVAPLCEAISSYYGGDYSATVDTMMPIRYDYQHVGGSHAQRDIFNLYLIDATIKSDRLGLAKSLLYERVTTHANHYDTWKRLAQVCDKTGDLQTAERARNELDRIVNL